MAVEIRYAPLSDLFLDPRNPRLGRAFHDECPSQGELYEEMRNWSLDELATSFLESGFWAHEAILCCEEELYGHPCLLVVEGNRRIAALKKLKNTYEGGEHNRKWLELIRDTTPEPELFARVPYIRISSRDDVAAFLGFRHVTGIKEWAPPEKAEFIYTLIQRSNLSYRDVMRRIGSQTPVVERNYVAYCILTQMKEIEDLDVVEVENRFSVLFLSLRSQRVRHFLGIEEKFGIEPGEVYPPVPESHVAAVKDFSLWLFGNQEARPIVKDSREVDRFAHVLGSDAGVDYLRSVKRPSLETAFLVAGGTKEEVYELVRTAAYNLQEALSSVHLYKEDERLLTMSRLLIANAEQIKQTLGLVEQ